MNSGTLVTTERGYDVALDSSPPTPASGHPCQDTPGLPFQTHRFWKSATNPPWPTHSLRLHGQAESLGCTWSPRGRAHTVSQARPADASATGDGQKGAGDSSPGKGMWGWPAKAHLSPPTVPYSSGASPSGAEKRRTPHRRMDTWTQGLKTFPSPCRPLPTSAPGESGLLQAGDRGSKQV